jgi:hypothetical protein
MNFNILEELMNEVNGATFVSIDTVTDVTLPGGKKNELNGRVQKLTEGSSVMVFQNKTINAYEAMVNRRLEKEGISTASFTVGPRSWGTRIQNTPFVEHKGVMYLEVIFLRPGNTSYLLDGKVTTDPSCIPASKENGVGDGWEQGGLINKVIIRTYKVDSIVGITINGQTFKVNR